MGLITCNICGRNFPAVKEDHYIAVDPSKTGLMAVIGDSDPSKQYDAVDCPFCGCQAILQERKPKHCPCEYDICDECEDSESEEDIDV